MTNEQIKKECYEILERQEMQATLLLVFAVVNVGEALAQMNELTRAGLSRDQAIDDLQPEEL